jgi:hypothetical protein
MSSKAPEAANRARQTSIIVLSFIYLDSDPLRIIASRSERGKGSENT